MDHICIEVEGLERLHMHVDVSIREGGSVRKHSKKNKAHWR